MVTAKQHWSDSDDPRRIQRGLYGSIWAWAVGLFVLVAVLSVAAWQLGWIFRGANVDRQVEIDNNNTGVQTAWRDEAMARISDFELVDPANTAARGALRNQACDLIGRLNDDYRNQTIDIFYQEEC